MPDNTQTTPPVTTAQVDDQNPATDDIVIVDESTATPTAGQTSAQAQTSGTAGATASDAVLQKFKIPDVVKQKYPDLIQLVIETESMNDDERKYWFQILPIMTPEQIEKFKKILVTEKEQLAKLDTEYQDEVNKLNQKHLVEWQDFERREERKKRQEAEEKTQGEESKKEEDLLKQLHEGGT